MWQSVIFFVLLFAVSISTGISQSVGCENIGFETGTFSGWKLSYGTVSHSNRKTIFVGESSGTRESEHLITSLRDGNDPRIFAEAIPMVAPGSNYSIRLGNTLTGTRFSRISSQYKITSDNALFQYQFAIVLQNAGTGQGGGGGHESFQKPGFNILIFDESGDELACSQYDIQLEGANTVAGFKSQGDIQYRNWTKGAIDLRKNIGKTITIVVTAHGCTERGHFGYAYFDAECFKSELNIASKCPDANGVIMLQAPNGFGRYEWSNGSNTSENRVFGKAGEIHSVKLFPLSSLKENCSVELEHELKYNAVENHFDATVCEEDGLTVGDTTYYTSGQYKRVVLQTSLCDSTVYVNLKVNKKEFHTQNVTICANEELKVGESVYTTSGKYEEVIKGVDGKCDSTVTTYLTVSEFDYDNLQTDYKIVEGESLQLSVTLNNTGDYNYSWSPKRYLSCSDCPNPVIKPDESISYTLTTTNNLYTCPAEKEFNILVMPCGVQVPNAFSPNGDGVNDYFTVMKNECVARIVSFNIYSRWGMVLFSTAENAGTNVIMNSDSWDGTYKGEKMPPGEYVYEIVASRNDEKLINKRGSFLLIR